MEIVEVGFQLFLSLHKTAFFQIIVTHIHPLPPAQQTSLNFNFSLYSISDCTIQHCGKYRTGGAFNCSYPSNNINLPPYQKEKDDSKDE